VEAVVGLAKEEGENFTPLFLCPGLSPKKG
jgi:hypothetical protein